MKKLLSIVLSVLMLGSFAVPYAAAEEITADNTAYREIAVSEAAYKYSINGGVQNDIAGEYGDDKRNIYSYAIFNSLDFGENTETLKYANLKYGNQYNRTGYISVISFGDYAYQEGDTVTFSGSVPTITRGTETFAGTMLLTDYTPAFVDNWGTVNECNAKIGDITGVNTIMIAVKDYCRISSVEFQQQTNSAYQEHAVTNSNHSVSLDNLGGDIAGAAQNNTDYGYAIFNSLDFGTNENTMKLANIKYTNAHGLRGAVSVISFGNYKYQEGDTVTWNGSVPTITRDGETFTGTMLLTDYAPELRGTDGSSWASYGYCNVKISDITGINTIMIAVKNYCRINSVEFQQQTKSAYQEYSISGADAKYSVNPGVGENIAGEYADQTTYSYAIFNSLDFGENTGTAKYANLKYSNQYDRTGFISFISFGDYNYKEGDTITFNGSVPTITRGDKTYTGTMLLTDYAPNYVNNWNAKDECSVKIKNITGISTIMVAVKNYCQISAIGFKQEAVSAYKNFGVTSDSDYSHSENIYSAPDIAGEPKDTFSYAVFNGLDFGSDADTVKYIKLRYASEKAHNKGRLYAFDMGDYIYADGDVISFVDEIPTVTRNGETVAVGSVLVSELPEHTANWLAFKEIVRPIGKLSGTHTVIAALKNYIKMSNVEFMAAAETKNAYTAELGINNAESHQLTSMRANDSELSFFGDTGAFKTVEWSNVDFGDDEQLVNAKVKIAVGSHYQNQPISVLIDGVEKGKLITTSTGGWYSYKDLTAALSEPISGKHSVALRFYAIGTGNLASLSFEKVPYQISFNEGDEKVTVKFTHNAELSELGDNNAFVTAMYGGSGVTDVKKADDLYNFGIESTECAVALPKKAGAEVKAFMFNDFSMLTPFMNAVSYKPQHTSAAIDAFEAFGVYDNVWNFEGVGVYKNDERPSGEVAAMCKDGWIHIGNVDFGSGAETVIINMMQASDEGTISLYADSLDSEAIATITTEKTVVGEEENPTGFSAYFDKVITGVHDIYLKFDTKIDGSLYTLVFQN